MPDFDPIVSVTLTRKSGAVETLPIEGTAPAPQPLPPLSNQSRLRMGITSQVTTSSWHLYRDAAKTSYPVGTNGGTGNQPVFRDQPAAHGTYTLLTEPAVDVVAVGSGTTTVEKDFQTVGKRFRVLVPQGQRDLTLLFRDGMGAPTNPTSVKLFRPGYTDDSDSIFTREAKRQLSPMGGMRFLDVLSMNGNPLVTWAERPLMTDPAWGGKVGAPLEIPIALCNETGKDAWVHIPHAADDSYIQGFKALFESTLRPDVNCYVEYSNELWNSKDPFRIARNYALDQTRAAIASGDTTLTKADENAQHPNGLKPNGTARNETYALWRWCARRSVEIAKLLGPRFKMILCGHSAEPLVLRVGLQHVEKYLGPPKDFFDAIADAPYMGLSAADQKRTDLTAPQVAELLVAGADPEPQRRAATLATANQYGLPYDAYECGLHLHQGASAQAIVDAQLLPRTGEAVALNMRNNFKSGMRNLWYFVVGSTHGWKPPKPDAPPGTLPGIGVWGSTRGTFPGAENDPKFLAMAELAPTVRQ